MGPRSALKKVVVGCGLRAWLFLGFLGSLSLSLSSEPRFTPEGLKAHVKYLASPQLEGRLSIAPGAHKAAEYIAKHFKKWGLEPKGEPASSYFQEFEMTIGVTLGKNNRLLATLPNGKQIKPSHKEFRPLGITANNTVEAEVVFVGYGISAPDQNYDEYAGVEVKGKIVLALRGVPNFGKEGNPFASYLSVRRKVQIAAEKGAVGFVLLNTPAQDQLLPLQGGGRGRQSQPGVVVVNVTRSLGDQLLQPFGLTVQEVLDQVWQTQKPLSRALEGLKLNLTAEVEPRKGKARNVIGFLPGNDPKLKEEIIVIGAHYDHLGWGEVGSLAPDSGGIHHGADDNASGTAGMLELARQLAMERPNLQRSLLFIAFAGEEEGLIGSAYFTNHPTVPIQNIVAMINLDMIGRMKNKRLHLGGIGTSPEWKSLIEKANSDQFLITLDQSGQGPSDHTSFYNKNIPVLFFFTGVHEDYHRPSDTWEKLNYEDQTKIVQMAYRVVKTLEEQPVRIAFSRAEPTQASQPRDRPARGGARVRIGLIPDYSDQSGTGVLLSGVRVGSPAEKAGLKAGDRIIELAGKKIAHIEELTDLFANLKAGEPVKIKVLREGQELELTVIPAAVE